MSVKLHESYCLDSIQDRCDGFDHFWGDSLDARWDAAGAAGGSAVVVDAQDGGIVRLTTDGDTNDSWYIWWGDIRSLHVDKKVTIEARVKPAQTDSQIAIISLHYDNNNRIYFRHDTDVGANWLIRTVNGGVQTSQDSGITADTDYHIFKIECFPAGEVHYYIDDVECSNSPITTNIPDDAGDYLQPQLLIYTRENDTKVMDVDYVWWRQDR